MPINIASYLLPRAGNSYALLEDTYLKGGFRIVADLAARDAIDATARKAGMYVVTNVDNVMYRLNPDLTTWATASVQGPQGPAGAQGVQGQTGPAGPQGTQGPVGDIGPAGPQGIQGPQGVKGDTGATGPQGDIGLTGPQGLTGAQGIQGPQGPQGAIGDTGLTGPKGDIGAQGIQGVKGDQGIQGIKGDTGDTGLTGPQGVKGDTGAAGPQGIQGLQGPKGDTGDTGLKGDTGLTGPAGATGDTGPQGLQGIKGDTGDTGPQGLKGDTGDTGLTGPQGLQGIQGAKGDTGDVGPAGPKGDTGATGAQGAGLNNRGNWIAATYNPEDYVSATASTNGAVKSLYFLIGNAPYVSSVSPGSDLSHWLEFSAVEGPAGATGSQGPIGLTGPAGPQGVKGDTGADGAQGIQGLKGDTGDVGPAGPQGLQGIQGETGNTGASGSAWWSVVSVPTLVNLPLAVSGDWALNNAGDVYQLLSGTWTLKTSLKGPQGDTGAQGVQGIQGAKGDTGLTGPQGIQGSQGPVGLTGPAGAQGLQGLTGPAGASTQWWVVTGAPSIANIPSPAANDIALNSTTGDVYQYVNAAWTQKANIMGPSGSGGSVSSLVLPYDIGFYVAGNMDTASTIVGTYIAPRTTSLKTGLADSTAKAVTPPQATTTYNININGVTQGSLQFAAWSSNGVFTWNTGINLSPGDLLEIVTPATVETFIKDVAITIVGFATATVGTMLP
jgi:hypothetical protein